MGLLMVARPLPPPPVAPRALLTQPWPVLEPPQLGEGTRLAS